MRILGRSLHALILVGVLLGISAAAAHAEPTLSRVEETAEGYKLMGSGFGKDKARVQVFEGATQVAATAIVSVADRLIEVRSKLTGTVQLKVKVGGRESGAVSFTPAAVRAAAKAKAAEEAKKKAAEVRPQAGEGRTGRGTSSPITLDAAGPLTLSRVERTRQGYLLHGRGFGTDRTKVEVIEGTRAVSASAIAAVTDTQIDVRVHPTGTVQHKVKVGGRESGVVSFEHPGAPAIASGRAGGTSAATTADTGPAPTLRTVEKTSDGYVLWGEGFGESKTALQVFEGATQLAATAIVSVMDSRLAVRSQPTGNVQHKVVRSGKASRIFQYSHSQAASSTTSSTTPAPTLTAVERTAEGYALVGSGFGTGGSIAVLEDSGQIASANLVARIDTRIDVRSQRRSGVVQHKVERAGRASNMVQFDHTAPVLARVERTATGYALVGSGFGTSRGEIRVVENRARLSENALVTLRDDRIEVLSRPTGSAQHQVRVGSRETNTVTFDHTPPAGTTPPPPLLTSVTVLSGGYRLAGIGFGNDASRIHVLEGTTRIAASSVASVTDTLIQVGVRPTGAVEHSVRLVDATGGSPAQSNVVSADYSGSVSVPAIAEVVRTADGYALIGSSFKAATPVKVFQGATEVAASLVTIATPERIDVRSQPAGIVEHRVTGGDRASNVVVFDHAPPVTLTLTSLRRGSTDYVLSGNFGSNATQAQVFEGATQVPAGSVAAANSTHIAVQRSPNGVVEHRVVVAGASSNVLSFDHNAARVDQLTVPGRVMGGTATTGTVRLAAPVTAGEVRVALSGGQSGVSVPSGVTVSSGQDTVEFPVTTSAVTTTTTVTLSAAASGQSRTDTVTVLAPFALEGLSFASSTVAGGDLATAQFTLNQAPQSEVVTLSVASDNPAVAAVPESARLASNANRTGTFQIATATVTAPTTVTISATLSGVTKTATLTVQPPGLDSVTLAERIGGVTGVVGGNPATGTVTLVGVAQAGGMTVSLSSSDTSATVPALIRVPAGSSTASFSIATTAVTSGKTVTISASHAGATRTASMSVRPALGGLIVRPNAVFRGVSAQGEVSLNVPAPSGGAVVSLASADPALLTVPASVTVPPGSTFTTFALSTGSSARLASTASVRVTAGYAGATRAYDVGVKPYSVASLTFGGDTLRAGTCRDGAVTLDGPAPPGGLTVNLSYAPGQLQSAGPDATLLARVFTLPASVTVPDGATQQTFPITTRWFHVGSDASGTRVSTRTPLVVTGATGEGTSQTATLGFDSATEVEVGSLAFNPASLPGGGTTTGSLTLAAPVPTGCGGSEPQRVAVVDRDNGSLVQAFNFAAGESGPKTFTLTFPPPGSSPRFVGFQARNRNASIIVPPPGGWVGLLNFGDVNACPGPRETTGHVTLNSSATSATTVTLSSDTIYIRVPGSITIPAGDTRGTFTVTLIRSRRNQAVGISAQILGFTSRSDFNLAGYECP